MFFQEDKQSIIDNAFNAYTDLIGGKPFTIAWAPGRIEVLGNHTDYNAGTALSAAIDLGLCFCMAPSSQSYIRAIAIDLERTAYLNTFDDLKVPGAKWATYIKGVFYHLQRHTKQTIDEVNCTFSSSIPIGGGLSSSAALEVAAATAVTSLLSLNVEPKEIAKICQKAEHQFIGTNCGLLDQITSIYGRENGLIHTDFKTLEISDVTLPTDIDFLVVNPHVEHNLADSPYNERRECCEHAAKQLNELLPYPVNTLSDVSLEDFEQVKHKIDKYAAQRATHIIGEIDRVAKGVQAAKLGDMEAFGELLYQSHQSSIDNFENSCPELDHVVNAARNAGALGARLSGGGFGGVVIVMMYADRMQTVMNDMEEELFHLDIHPDLIRTTPSAGAHIIL